MYDFFSHPPFPITALKPLLLMVSSNRGGGKNREEREETASALTLQRVLGKVFLLGPNHLGTWGPAGRPWALFLGRVWSRWEEGAVEIVGGGDKGTMGMEA